MVANFQKEFLLGKPFFQNKFLGSIVVQHFIVCQVLQTHFTLFISLEQVLLLMHPIKGNLPGQDISIARTSIKLQMCLLKPTRIQTTTMMFELSFKQPEKFAKTSRCWPTTRCDGTLQYCCLIQIWFQYL